MGLKQSFSYLFVDKEVWMDAYAFWLAVGSSFLLSPQLIKRSFYKLM